MRSLLPRSLLLIVLVPSAGPGRAADPPAADGPLGRAQALYRQKKYGEALKLLEELREGLPADARLSRWRLDPPPGQAGWRNVLVGRDHVYLVFYSQARGRDVPLALPDDRPVLKESLLEYGPYEVILCLDAATGKRRWSRVANASFRMAVDPGSDDLYCWREVLLRLSAATGDVQLRKDLPRGGKRIEGLAVAGGLLVPRLKDLGRSFQSPEAVTVYHVATETVGPADALRPSRLSPDEKFELRTGRPRAPGADGSAVGCYHRGTDVLAWEYVHPGSAVAGPFWHEEDVFALTGGEPGRAEVVCLEGAAGKPRWRFGLPRGAYPAGWAGPDQGLHANRDWEALRPSRHGLVAMAADGTLYFLDPRTGRPAARTAPFTEYMAPPRLTADTLLVCSPRALRAVPLDVVFKRRADDERHVALWRAKCLAALGKTPEALAEVRDLLEQEPDFAPGWPVRAELCREARLPAEEAASRSRSLDLDPGGPGTDLALQQRWGLLRRIATGQDLRERLEAAGDTLYARTAAGEVLAIDARSLEVVARRELPSPLAHLTTEVRLKSGRRLEETPFDLDADLANPPGAPDAWRVVSGLDGPVVRWRGKLHRPLGGGRVRVLDGENRVSEHTTPIPGGIYQWRVHLDPAGPLGYGSGGVYELDDNLCPVRRCIDLGPGARGAPAPEVVLMAGDGQTLGVVAPGRDGVVRLEVWARDGGRKLREEALQRPVAGTVVTRPGGLTPLAGGYLFSGSELAWVSPDPAVPAWHFGFGDRPGRAAPPVRYAHTAFFGVPVVRGDFLFAGCRDGAVYVFDVGRVVGRR